MSKEEFIKQRCEIDKITEKEFEEQYRVVDCDCGKPYCKGYRCLDLDDLLKENQELKKQLEEINYTIIPNCDIRPLIDKFRTQQKEFIKWLEDESKEVYRDGGLRQNIFRQILQKYKEIIGGK